MPTPPDGHYVTITDIRSEGITVAQASDQVVSDTIVASELNFESWTQRWFYRRTNLQLTFDGGEHYSSLVGSGEYSDIMDIPVPCLNLTAIEINTQAKTVGNFINYNQIGAPRDDRFRPKIVSKYYEWPLWGLQNIKITGDWGFIEETTNYTTPIDVKRACRRLTIRNLPFVQQMTKPDRQLFLNEGRIIQEVTDGYEYKIQARRSYSDTEPLGWADDPEIDAVVLRYRWSTGFAAA
jgi:hypothetical protein